MAFREQTIGGFLDATAEASAALKAAGFRSRILSLEEGLIMQAYSHLLLNSEGFYGQQIVEMTPLGVGTIHPTLRRFEERCGLIESTQVEGDVLAGRRNPRRLITATEFGEQIMSLYQPGDTPPGA